MSGLQVFAFAVLVLVVTVSLGAALWAPAPYEKQFREAPNAPPSARFPLGTDELGRDRLSRLLFGSRLSLLLAPAAALLSTGIAVCLGLAAAHFGGWIERAVLEASDLFSSVPWLFLLLAVRAMLPLNVPPITSVGITFALLGLLGWASGVRVVRAAVVNAAGSDFVLQARACGCAPRRILFVHLAAAILPVLTAQYWLAVPQFLLAEANLGILGLGVTEPLPSWGNMLADLQNVPAILEAPWRLAPALLLLLVLGCFQLVLSKKEVQP
ncbi:MAG: ABC transporter permease [Bryobacterales bacterium]|nr:ABC transporter permease [Bryobacterales bacterium]